ncbi:FlgD immunoglobulin-like domain containing protein [Candidatus Neomarinimicrobiota bacterium]
MKLNRIVLFTLIMLTVALAQGPQRRGGNRGPLTDEQRAQMEERMEQMREQMEARLAVLRQRLQEEAGLPPARWNVSVQPARVRLTENQRAELQALQEQLRAGDVSREDARAAMENLYEQWGVDPRPAPLRLTEEQREAYRALLLDLRERQPERDAVLAEIEALFEGWGLDVEIRLTRVRAPRMRGLVDLPDNITDEQRQAVADLTRRMREEGASREAIQEAVQALLNGSADVDASLDGEDDEDADNLQASNSPNPFNPDTRISYSLPADATVTVRIYNLTGQVVRTYQQGFQTAGSHDLTWDGNLSDGSPASTGVYLYQIQAGNNVVTKRMTLMK